MGSMQHWLFYFEIVAALELGKVANPKSIAWSPTKIGVMVI